MNIHLETVSSRIGEAVAEFVNEHENKEFHASDLQTFVREKVGHVAPSSPTRILQDMRKRGLLNYELISRSKSLYRGLSLGCSSNG